MLARWHVLLLERRDAIRREHALAGEANQRRPHAAVNERDLNDRAQGTRTKEPIWAVQPFVRCSRL